MNINISVSLEKSEIEKILKETIEKSCPGYVAQSLEWEVLNSTDWRGEVYSTQVKSVKAKLVKED